ELRACLDRALASERRIQRGHGEPSEESTLQERERRVGRRRAHRELVRARRRRTREAALDEQVEERLFALDIVVERARRHPHFASHVGHLCPAVALGAEDTNGRGENLCEALLGAADLRGGSATADRLRGAGSGHGRYDMTE